MWQVRERHKEDGTSVSHAEKQGTGKLYVQCLLNDLGLGDFDEWITTVEAAGDASLERGMGDILRRLVVKVKAVERWRLPEGRYGSEDEKKRLGRQIVVSHVKEIQFALTRAINEKRAGSSFFQADPVWDGPPAGPAARGQPYGVCSWLALGYRHPDGRRGRARGVSSEFDHRCLNMSCLRLL